MKQLTRVEALEQGYEQCMPKYDGADCIDLISNLDDDEGVEWLSNDDNPIMLMSTKPDIEKSNEIGYDWYPITDIRLIP